MCNTAVRSPGELAFRLRQEIANVWLWFRPPSVPLDQPAPLHGLPAPEPVVAALQGTPFALETERLAGEILEHRFPLLGHTIKTGPNIRWRRDPVHQLESGLPYFRRVPFLNFSKVGDHKLIWELNRHQHLVVLAQAFLFGRRRELLQEIERQIESWMAANPFQRGINWASALEVAFRALSWIWIYHFVGQEMDAGFRHRFLNVLYRHGLHLEYNLSVYFSPNTHLLGEAVVLNALGTLFPAFPRAPRWQRLGGEFVRRQMKDQVQEDGTHFEQSTYYHLYALDMFLFHWLLTNQLTQGAFLPGKEFKQSLYKMADYLATLLGPNGSLPFMGDDDGGRLFHPYGPRERFAGATLSTSSVVFGRDDWLGSEQDLHTQAAWWLGSEVLRSRKAGSSPQLTEARSRLFPQAGTAVMCAGDLRVIIDAGPFGAGSGGHSHSDTLSVIVTHEKKEILIDPGTYTYTADARWRNWFRGSAAHNTMRVDGRDQATPNGPFGWKGRPEVEILSWQPEKDGDFLDALCRYDGLTHRRRVLRVGREVVFICDELTGLGGEHLLEQFWHFGVAEEGCRLILPGNEPRELEEGGEYGWRSKVLGEKGPAPVLRVSRRTALPATFWALLDFSNCPGELQPTDERTCTYTKDARCTKVHFSEEGYQLWN